MRVQRDRGDAGTATVRLEFPGFGAFQALRQEGGIEVLESPLGGTMVRHSVRVVVYPDPPAASATVEAESRICRRYDDGLAPLVRDKVRGWRSGKLARVLSGDFDLVGTPQQP